MPAGSDCIGFTATRRLFWILLAAPAIWPPHVPLSAFLWAGLIIAIYKRLAGILAVDLARALVARQLIVAVSDRAYSLTDEGHTWCRHSDPRR